MGLLVAIIYIGKPPFHIINDGFTGEQWGICIGFSAITFVVSFLVKLLPIQNCIDPLIAPKNEEEEQEKEKNKDVLIKSEESKRNLTKIYKYDEVNSPMGEIMSMHSKKMSNSPE